MSNRGECVWESARERLVGRCEKVYSVIRHTHTRTHTHVRIGQISLAPVCGKHGRVQMVCPCACDPQRLVDLVALLQFSSSSQALQAGKITPIHLATVTY